MAFPDGEDFPAGGLELAEIAAVSAGVAEALGGPVFGVVDGVFAFALAGVHVRGGDYFLGVSISVISSSWSQWIIGGVDPRGLWGMTKLRPSSRK